MAVIKIDRKLFYLFLGLILVSGIYVVASNVYVNYNMMGNNITNITVMNAGNITGNLTWTYLYGYPVACPADSAITQLGDSVTCTAFNIGSTWVNATNVNATKVYADWYCLTVTCDHNVSFNGTDTIIQ